MKKIIKKNVFVVFTILSFASCKKWIEIPQSKNQVESPTVFADSLSANSALLGVYFTLGTASANALTTAKNLSLYTDELFYTATATAQQQYNLANVTPENTQNLATWVAYYNVIYQANAVIENLATSQTITANTVQRMQAEAKFLRAYCYFNLFYTYQQIPLLLGTNVNRNALAPPAAPTAIVNQIIADLLEAQSVLPSTYNGTGRVRANSYAAKALLARVYLYQKQWQNAITAVDALVNSNNYLPLPKPEDTFVATSKEAIWQCWNANGFVADATAVIPSTNTSVPAYILTSTFLQSFETKDLRKTKWVQTNTNNAITYYYPAKYKNRVSNTTLPEYFTPLRMAEMLLIRAEALAQLNLVAQAVSDLNLVRARAGLSEIAKDIPQTTCVMLIEKERQIELFAELGHRYYDLKRWNALATVLLPIKPTFKSQAGLNFPIPNTELMYNKNLKQNEGY